MFKVDLHTHSEASPDGGLTPNQYQKALKDLTLDYIAITDHNRIDVAQSIQQTLGQQIIVGEEIMTSAGEIIGLFLQELIPAGLSPTETIDRVKSQGGLVYIPHPFETVRKGLHPGVLEEIADQIDIVEVCNGRSFLQNRNAQTVVWARLNHKAGAASSDAHGYRGLGKTYTSLEAPPTADNLQLLMATAKLITDHPNLHSLLYPTYHRWRRKLKKT